MSKIYWPYIISAYLSLLALGFTDNVRGPYFPEIIKDLSLTDTEASLFFAVTSLFTFFSSLLANRFLHILGSVGGLRLGLLLMFIGVATLSQAPNLSLLLACCCIFGFGFGMLTVYQHTAIQDASDIKLRRRLFSGLHSFYAGASLVAPLLVGPMIGAGWTWRQAFLLFSFLPLLILLYTLFVKRIPVHGHQEQKAQFSFRHWLHMLVCAHFVGAYVAAELSVSTRLVVYVQREFAIAPEPSTLYLAVFFAGLLIGRLTFTLFDFKTSSRTILNLSLLTSILSFAFGLYYSPWLLALCGLTMAPFFAVAMDYLSAVFPRSTSSAMAFALGFGALTVVAMHFFLGLLTDVYGLKSAMHLGLFLLLFSFMILNVHDKIFSPRSETK